MANEDLNTGVETVQDAAGQQEYEYGGEFDDEGLEDGIQDDVPADTEEPEAEEPEEEGVTVEELLAEDDDEGKGVKETSAADLPSTEPEGTKPEDTNPEPNAPAPQVDPKAFAAKLKNEREKMEREVADTLGVSLKEASEIVLEKQARDLMEKNKGMNMTFEFAKEQILLQRGLKAAQQPTRQTEQPAAQQQEPAQKKPEVDNAVIERMKSEEKTIQMFDKDFSIVKYKDNPVFRQAYAETRSIADAYQRTKEYEDGIRAAAKKEGQQETIKSITSSAKKAPTNTSKETGAPRPKDPMKMTDAEIERINHAVKMGARVKNYSS